MSEEIITGLVVEPEKLEKKVLTDAEREEVRNIIADGKLRPAAAAAKFGISPSAISQICNKEPQITFNCRAKERERKTEIAAEAEVERLANKFGEQKAQFIENTKNEAYKDAVLVRQLGMKVVKETLAAGKDLATMYPHLKAIDKLAMIFQRSRSERYIVTDATTTINAEDLPEIHIRDLTEEEILMRQTPEEEFGAIEDLDLNSEDDLEVIEST